MAYFDSLLILLRLFADFSLSDTLALSDWADDGVREPGVSPWRIQARPEV